MWSFRIGHSFTLLLHFLLCHPLHFRTPSTTLEAKMWSIRTRFYASLCLSVRPLVCLRLPASPCAESAKRKYPFTFLSWNVAFVIFRFFSRRIMMREARDTPTAIFFVYHLGRFVQHKHTNVILVVHLCVSQMINGHSSVFLASHRFCSCFISRLFDEFGGKKRVANGLSAIVMVYNHHQRSRQWPGMARIK